MDLTIEIPDTIGAVLKAQAQAHGLSASRYASQVIEESLVSHIAEASQSQGFETGYGTWAKYGSAPSADELDENRRDMFRNFGRDL